MIFAFLFGLSMDYEVFILSRMREEYDRTGSTETAVIRGIGRTGRLVTSAALILFLAFTAMASGPGTDLKMMATGLAAGILLDATVIRALIVPAVISLMGRWNWWLPEWPARLLRVEPSLPPGFAGAKTEAVGSHRATRINIASPEFEYDAGDPPGFRAGMAALRPAARRVAARGERLRAAPRSGDLPVSLRACRGGVAAGARGTPDGAPSRGHGAARAVGRGLLSRRAPRARTACATRRTRRCAC